VIDLLQATKNQTKTASLMRMGFNQVNYIMHKSVERGLERRGSLGEVKHISIDEKSFKRGHDYVTVLSNPETGAILNVSHGRKKEDAKSVINETFSSEQKQKIETVSTDMWEAYINTVKEELPKSKLCHDKFHLVKYLNEAVDIVRRRETKKQDDLRHTRYIWLKDKANLTENQRLKFEAINNTNYETARAWRIKENFRDIIFNQPFNEAFALFLRWLTDALNSKINPVIKVAEMFKRHAIAIINAMVLNRNNAMAERLNGKIQEIKLSAKGYRTFENFRTAILFFHGKLKLYPQESV
jgi:transposase